MKIQPFRVVASSAAQDDGPFALTIAVPTFKRAALLTETLRSIATLAFATRVEVIVVDNDPDGDDAQAAQLIAGLITGPYRYYRNHDNVGMFGNWNQCLFLAKGRYITILHDDDLLSARFGPAVDQLLLQGALTQEIVGFHVAMLEQRPDRSSGAAALPVSALYPDVPGTSDRLSMQLYSVADLFFANLFCGTLGVLFNREQAVALGGFRAEWAPIADYEFWCRWAATYGPIPMANWEVAQYRIGQNESMKLETRLAFVTKSRELRLHLIARHAVPGIFTRLMGIVTFTQRSQIYRDWRTADEPPVSLSNKIAMKSGAKALQFAVRVTKWLGLAGKSRTASK